MQITLNGTALETQAQTLSALLIEQGHGEGRVATALNEVFVAATQRDTTPLSPGDRVEIVTPRQGG